MRVPGDYIRKQTLANAERYITPALKEYEAMVLGAEDKIKELEFKLFSALRDAVAMEAERHAAIGPPAGADSMCWPILPKSPRATAIAARCVTAASSLQHSSMAATRWSSLTLAGERFVPNDALADTATDQLIIITGPNMSGKSTLLTPSRANHAHGATRQLCPRR